MDDTNILIVETEPLTFKELAMELAIVYGMLASLCRKLEKEGNSTGTIEHLKGVKQEISVLFEKVRKEALNGC